MVILGLTGSLAMGKSTAAAMLRRMGVPVCDSDALVHRLLGSGGRAVPAVGAAFPGVVTAGAVDRAALARYVFDDPAALRRLEAILHPMVQDGQHRFLAGAAARGAALAVLDVPLLYETRGDRRCDAVAVVTAPGFLQRQRALRRANMSTARLRAVLARQLPDAEKRRRATFVVPTGNGRRDTLIRLKRIVTLLSRQRGKRWPPDPYRQRWQHHA